CEFFPAPFEPSSPPPPPFEISSPPPLFEISSPPPPLFEISSPSCPFELSLPLFIFLLFEISSASFCEIFGPSSDREASFEFILLSIIRHLKLAYVILIDIVFTDFGLFQKSFRIVN